MTPDGPPASRASRDGRRRRWPALALIVIASVVGFAAIFSVWINRQILNTDNWTSASTQMLERPVIRNQVAAYLTDQLYANVDMAGQIRSVLPVPAKGLAGPAADALRGQLQNVAASALARPRVQELWEQANRRAHLALLDVLHGRGSVVSATDGEVVLDLRALLLQTEQRAGIGGRLAGALPAGAGHIVILRSHQLALGQDVGRLLEHLPVLLVGLSLLLFGAALLLAPGWRRSAVRAYGTGLIVAGAGALVAESWAGDMVVDALAATASVKPAIRAVWDIYTPLLEQAATATILYGVVMVLGAWLAGPTRWATAIRRATAPVAREPAIAYGGFALLVAIVVFSWAPTPATRNPVTAGVLLALLAVGFEGLRRRTAREFAARGSIATGGARAATGPVVRQAPAFPSGMAGERTASADERVELLERLQALRVAGVLADAEFEAEKARILTGDGIAPAAPPVA